MVVTVRLHLADPLAYGHEVSNSLEEVEDIAYYDGKVWIVEISGLTQSVFEQFHLWVSWDGIQDPVQSSNNANCYVATPATDQLLNNDYKSMPLPAAVNYLNVLEKCGLKILSQTACIEGEHQEKCIIWTLLNKNDQQ